MQNPALQQTQIVGKDWYIYSASALAIGAGDNVTDTINIQANSDFMLYKLSYVAYMGLGPVTEAFRQEPLVSVQLTDTGSGQQLFSNQLPLTLMFGTGERIYTLPQARRFRANTTMSINFLNFSAGTTYDIYLAFHGMKMYAND